MASKTSTTRETEAANKVVEWFPNYLSFSKGRFGGKPFALKPWQEGIIRDIFGPHVYDEELGQWVRKIRTAYVEMPRKNGKTELGAGIALRLLFADKEKGAEVYSVAEDLDQANKVFAAARTMVEADDRLLDRCKVYKRLIEHQNGSIYRVIPSDAAGNHGHNPSGVIFDELHTQKTRDLWDVMTSGQGTRAQPLTVAFTTAGTDKESICWEQHDYGEKVAKGLVTDPSFYYCRYGQADGDDWEDEEVWKRCNPALGDFLLMSFLRSEYAKAKASPARQNAFRNLYLTEWTQQVERWIDMGVWDESAGSVVEPDLGNQTCFGGLDLASVSDLTAWVMAFPQDDGKVKLVGHYFVPEAALQSHRKYSSLYRQWESRPNFHVTPGEATDYGFVRAQIVKDANRYYLGKINMDYKFQGGQLASELLDDEGLPVESFSQTHMGYGDPMREFERLLLERKLEHGGDPIMRWAADNVVARQDENGNLKPDKKRSQDKIDPIVAAVMAIAGIDANAGSEPGVAVF